MPCRTASRSPKVRYAAVRSVIQWLISPAGCSGVRVSSARWVSVSGSGSAERCGGWCWPGGGGFDRGAQAGKVGGGADLAELGADVLWCPTGGFDGVGVAQVQRLPVGHAADAGSVGGSEGGQGLYQAARRSGAAASPAPGPIGSAGSRRPDSSRQTPMEAARFCRSTRFWGSSGTGPRAVTARGRACRAACSPMRSGQASISAVISVRYAWRVWCRLWRGLGTTTRPSGLGRGRWSGAGCGRR